MFLILLTILAATTVVVQAVPLLAEGKVPVYLYYEALCPHCREFYPEVVDVVTKLGPYIDLFAFPYGKADTQIKDGEISFTCQHGPRAYLNQVHGCAQAVFKENATAYVIFNECIFENDAENNVELCGKKLNVNPKPIKDCAEGRLGMELHLFNGIETRKVHLHEVPHTVVNGRVLDYGHYKKGDLFKEVCAQINPTPDVCKRP